MTERHTIFREPCLACDICQARALSNLPRPNNVNLLEVAGFIVYKNYQNMPKFDPLYIFYPYATKWHFRNPLYKKKIIFETHYPKKNSIFEAPIQKTGIFETSISNKMAFQRRTIQKSAIFETPYKTKWPFRDPL